MSETKHPDPAAAWRAAEPRHREGVLSELCRKAAWLRNEVKVGQELGFEDLAANVRALSRAYDVAIAMLREASNTPTQWTIAMPAPQKRGK